MKNLVIGGIEFCYIPSGSFIMGSNSPDAMNAERPGHTVVIPYDYYISRYLITNSLYLEFVNATGASYSSQLPLEKNNLPVVQVSAIKAREFCRWFEKKHDREIPMGFTVALPSEAEWEKAARGPDGNEYPWGNFFDASRLNGGNYRSTGSAGRVPNPVGYYSPRGDSPYGAADMVGNVLQWTRTIWGEDPEQPQYGYPYDPKDGREASTADTMVRLVTKGDSFFNPGGPIGRKKLRCSYKGSNYPDVSEQHMGFRVVLIPDD